jgi:hypothetical protein
MRKPKYLCAREVVFTDGCLHSWAAFAYVLGWEGLKQWRTWEAPLWLQLLVPVLTMVFKIGYLTGAFGKDRVPEKKGNKKL